jgi:hypothetical protein
VKLRISISVEPDYDPSKRENVSGNLQLQEQFEVGSLDFLEVCRILGQFDELAKRLSRKP